MNRSSPTVSILLFCMKARRPRKAPESSMRESTAKRYPLMPLRDIVIFPGMVAPLVVGRKKSIAALENAMENRSMIFLVTQKDDSIDDPGREHLYEIGTL